MHTITYQLNQAIEAAKATLPHASRDDVTPILCAVNVTPEAWYATDRYTIGKYTITPTDTDFEPVAIPIEAIEWVSKIVYNKLRHKPKDANDYQLTITHDKPNILVNITWQGNVERAQSFETIEGNYPPIERLVNDWKPAHETGIEAYPVRLAPRHIEKVTTYVKRHDKEAPVTIELGKPYNHDERHKPSPVRFTYGNLTAIVQPNLRL